MYLVRTVSKYLFLELLTLLRSHCICFGNEGDDVYFFM